MMEHWWKRPIHLSSTCPRDPWALWLVDSGIPYWSREMKGGEQAMAVPQPSWWQASVTAVPEKRCERHILLLFDAFWCCVVLVTCITFIHSNIIEYTMTTLFENLCMFDHFCTQVVEVLTSWDWRIWLVVFIVGSVPGRIRRIMVADGVKMEELRS